LQDELGDRVLDLLLDGALERPRAEHRIEAHAGNLRQRGIGDFELHLLLFQAFGQALELDARDGLDMLRVQAMEDHDFIDAVQELRAQGLLEFFHHHILDDFVGLARHALDLLRAQVGRHHKSLTGS
jgi:hypothetical protein